jgi:hypothetical protein
LIALQKHWCNWPGLHEVEAEAVHRAALQLYTEVLGQKHPSTLASISNLALVLNHQEKYNEPRLYTEKLQLKKEVLGQKHPDKTTSLLYSHIIGNTTRPRAD